MKNGFFLNHRETENAVEKEENCLIEKSVVLRILEIVKQALAFVGAFLVAILFNETKTKLFQVLNVCNDDDTV